MGALSEANLAEIQESLDRELSARRELFAKELAMFTEVCQLTADELMALMQIDAESLEALQQGRALPTYEMMSSLRLAREYMPKMAEYAHLNFALATSVALGAGYIPMSLARMLLDHTELLDLLDNLAHGDHEEYEIGHALNIIKGLVGFLELV